MNTNFIIEENIYLKDSLNRIYDLHNDYDFVKYEFHCNEKRMLLTWKHTVDKKVIVIEHLNINYLTLNSNSFNEDIKTLSTICYFSSKDRDTNDSFTTSQKPEEGDDIIYFFENENYIRLNCDKISLSII